MLYKYKYKTPDIFSDICMNSDGEYLTGLWFDNSDVPFECTMNCEEKQIPIFKETIKWLDIYFSGANPNFIPKYKIDNLTPFRKDVIDIMNTIPFGETLTYNNIAKIIAQKKALKTMSSQAVGGAVGWNPICIIIPCHRVVGANGNLTGYSGGLNNKIELLKLAHNDMTKFFIPKRGSIL